MLTWTPANRGGIVAVARVADGLLVLTVLQHGPDAYMAIVSDDNCDVDTGAWPLRSPTCATLDDAKQHAAQMARTYLHALADSIAAALTELGPDPR